MEPAQLPTLALTFAYVAPGFIFAAGHGGRLRVMRADTQATARSHSLASKTLRTAVIRRAAACLLKGVH